MKPRNRTTRTTSTDPASRRGSDYRLSEIAERLERRFHGLAPRGYLPGKTEMRNALMDMLGLSAMDAEATVDRLQAFGLVRYLGDPRKVDRGDQPWIINRPPAGTP